jgi:hypothetical protein
MTSLHHDQQMTRRGVLIGVAACVIFAPAVVRAANLMPVRGLIFPIGRLRWEADHPGEPYPWLSVLQCWAWDSFRKDLEAGRTESSLVCNSGRLSEGELRRIVTFARRYQLLEISGNPGAYYGKTAAEVAAERKIPWLKDTWRTSIA